MIAQNSSVERNRRLGIFAKKLPGMLLTVFRFVVLFGLIFMIIYPFIFMFVTAFRSEVDLNDPSVVWITRHYTLDNFKRFLGMVNFPDMMIFTMVISLSCAVLQTFVCALAGYAFARFKFRGRNFLFVLLLFTIIVPEQTFIMQLFLKFRFFSPPGISLLFKLFTGKSSLNLLNTPFPFIIQSMFGMGIRSGLFIYIFRQFFRSLPSELENAACIDGSNALHTYFTVMVPNAIPAFVTVSMLSFVWNWNDYLSQSFLNMSRHSVATFLYSIHGTISVATQNMEDPTVMYILIQSGTLLCIAPLIFVFLFGQRYFTESVERTGIVG
ncbi:MAG: carbohydrate ABC transporter permease [Clostridia bacterium]|nr:carbohydrate ABC transporter permease [Clostridia bacterium]